MAEVRARLDLPMLVSLLLVGAFWLLLILQPWTDDTRDRRWFVVLTVYVVVGALAMAELYGRPGDITLRQEVLTLVALWAVATLMWAVILVPDSSWTAVLLAAWFAAVCFALWQLPALAGRALWRRLSRWSS